MAHFAELDGSNVVTQVIVVANSDCLDGDGNESEVVGIAFCEALLGGTWKQTSYNGTIRKQYAQIGDTYDATKNKFIKIKPYASWVLNDNDDWKAPSAYPDTGTHSWNESALRWDEVTQPE